MYSSYTDIERNEFSGDTALEPDPLKDAYCPSQARCAAPWAPGQDYITESGSFFSISFTGWLARKPPQRIFFSLLTHLAHSRSRTTPALPCRSAQEACLKAHLLDALPGSTHFSRNLLPDR